MQKDPRPKIRVRVPPRPAPADPTSFHAAVEDTLRQKVQEAVTANFTGGLLICGLALVAAVVTYWIAFAVLGLVTGWLFTLPYWLKRLLALGIVVGLYVLHARTHVEELAEIKVETRDDKPPFCIWYPPVGLLTNVQLFHPETLRSVTRLLAALCLISPQLMWAGLQDLRRARRLRELDTAAAATIISMMLGKIKKVSFAEIVAAHPHLDVSRVAAQLLELDGVVPLREDPPGLTLTPDLRQDFLAGCGLST
ncbi:hypothetical protein NXS98_11075 [Fontisphaera persica]|uniref:hypothetical protein n=1 Tax=Fontisphaera persica TaxID=2974023 RepID=UPI0024BFB991|nr:hypothetical protein [Fontisphaera persica]WCJ58267.1 hypothetical protein NXS98_11075 [Fontisphaera persica]